jgi:hypothetical protein
LQFSATGNHDHLEPTDHDYDSAASGDDHNDIVN